MRQNKLQETCSQPADQARLKCHYPLQGDVSIVGHFVDFCVASPSPLRLAHASMPGVFEPKENSAAVYHFDGDGTIPREGVKTCTASSPCSIQS